MSPRRTFLHLISIGFAYSRYRINFILIKILSGVLCSLWFCPRNSFNSLLIIKLVGSTLVCIPNPFFSDRYYACCFTTILFLKVLKSTITKLLNSDCIISTYLSIKFRYSSNLCTLRLKLLLRFSLLDTTYFFYLLTCLLTI